MEPAVVNVAGSTPYSCNYYLHLKLQFLHSLWWDHSMCWLRQLLVVSLLKLVP